MFSVTTKQQYWNYLDSGAAMPGVGSLKNIQDAFILYHLHGLKGKRILEMGGGVSRVLPKLIGENECWNADKFEGLGGGLKSSKAQDGVKVVPAYLGEFSNEIPECYFDYVISISVLEHVASASFPVVINDCFRVLKPGGSMLHAIDIYLLDRLERHPHGASQRERLRLYKSVPDIVNGGFRWMEPPAVDEDVTANATIAGNSADRLYAWNRIAPALRGVREIAVSCNLALGVTKLA